MRPSAMSDPDRADSAGSSDEGVTDHAPENVARLVRRVLREEADHGEVRRLIHIAWKIALVYLRQKRSSGQLDTSHFSVGLEDLALDCIGPLFERDEHGRFVELNRYFSSLRDEVRSDREIARRFRQLISSRLEQELFDLHGAADPSLSRFIRNIKRAARNSDAHHLERRHGDLWVIWEEPEGPDEEHARPVITSEILEMRLLPHLEPNITGPEILDAAGSILAHHEDYQPELPVTLLAWAVRSGLARLHEEEDTPKLIPVGYPSRERLSELIEDTLETIRTEKRSTYVESGKIGPSTYESYLAAVERILRSLYLEEGSDVTYFEALGDIIPVSREEYRDEHRSRLEYLVDVSRQHLADALRREAAPIERRTR